MAKVCEMIVNRDYIRENNAGHPPCASYRTYVSSARAGGGGYVRAYLDTCIRVCTRTYVYAGAMLSRTCVKKSGLARGRVSAGGGT